MRAECRAGSWRHREPRQKHSLSITLKATPSSQAPPPKGSIDPLRQMEDKRSPT